MIMIPITAATTKRIDRATLIGTAHILRIEGLCERPVAVALVMLDLL